MGGWLVAVSVAVAILPMAELPSLLAAFLSLCHVACNAVAWHFSCPF